MRDPKRIDKMINLLRDVWHANPDMRLGQLMLNLTSNSRLDTTQFWHAEDEEWVDLMQRYLTTGSFV